MSADRRYLVQHPNRTRTGPHAWEELERMARNGELRAGHALIDDKTGERTLVSDIPVLAGLIHAGGTTALPVAGSAATPKTLLLGIASLPLAVFCGCVGSILGGAALFLGYRDLKGNGTAGQAQTMVGMVLGGISLVAGVLVTLAAAAALAAKLASS